MCQLEINFESKKRVRLIEAISGLHVEGSQLFIKTYGLNEFYDDVKYMIVYRKSLSFDCSSFDYNVDRYTELRNSVKKVLSKMTFRSVSL